jgi:hypothetical protein
VNHERNGTPEPDDGDVLLIDSDHAGYPPTVPIRLTPKQPYETERVTQRTQKTQSTQSTQEDSNPLDGAPQAHQPPPGRGPHNAGARANPNPPPGGESSVSSVSSVSSELSVSSVYHAPTWEQLIREVGDSLPERNTFAWTQAVFRLARVLRAHGVEDPGAVRDVIIAWHGRLCGESDLSEVWTELRDCWHRVRAVHGLNPDEVAALPDYDPLPEEARMVAENPLYARLIRICRNFHRVTGGDKWFFGCRDAGRLLGISHCQANRMLNTLAADGVLKKESTGSMDRIPGSRKLTASEWRYVASE